MAVFDRLVRPNNASAFTVPTGVRSAAPTGTLKTRPTTAKGRQWVESYPPMRAGTADVEAFLAQLERYWSQMVTFDIKHLWTPGSGESPNGEGSSGVLVNGADQTGESIDTDGWPVSTSNVVRAGDVVRIDGLDPLYRITADADSNSSGEATLQINPPIFSGASPADDAAVTTTDCIVKAVLWQEPQIPSAAPGGHYTGMQLHFREDV